jgi:hypothetical protein
VDDAVRGLHVRRHHVRVVDLRRWEGEGRQWSEREVPVRKTEGRGRGEVGHTVTGETRRGRGKKKKEEKEGIMHACILVLP